MEPKFPSEFPPVPDLMAEGAWTRLRNLIGALDRVDRLETSPEFDGWLKQLQTDEHALEATIREFLLRAVRLAADPINWQILLRLRETNGATLSALLELTHLPRVELAERVNELARAGLTIQTLDEAVIEITPFGRGWLHWLDKVTERIREQAREDYLINPQAKMPNPPLHARPLRAGRNGSPTRP